MFLLTKSINVEVSDTYNTLGNINVEAFSLVLEAPFPLAGGL